MGVSALNNSPLDAQAMLNESAPLKVASLLLSLQKEIAVARVCGLTSSSTCITCVEVPADSALGNIEVRKSFEKVFEIILV